MKEEKKKKILSIFFSARDRWLAAQKAVHDSLEVPNVIYILWRSHQCFPSADGQQQPVSRVLFLCFVDL